MIGSLPFSRLAHRRTNKQEINPNNLWHLVRSGSILAAILAQGASLMLEFRIIVYELIPI